MDKVIKLQNKDRKKAFTLVEALVALSILIIGVMSGFILVTKALYDASIIRDRLTASFLAQEGIEFIRQIRDSNYVKNLANSGTVVAWNNNLADGDYIIAPSGNPPSSINLMPFSDKTLLWDKTTGLYNYDTGEVTTFKRKVTLKQVNADEIKVTVTINWTSKGIPFDLAVEDFLYNWLKL